MSEERLDRKSRLGEAEGRCLYSGDSHDDDVVRKRRKVQHEQEAECGTKLVDEGEEEEMQHVEAEFYCHGEEVGENEEVGEKEKEAEVGEEEEERYWAENSGGFSTSNKQKDEMSIDRLSALPDSLLNHILSFLCMQEAVMTSMLSKRWQFLWTDLPMLEFREMLSDSDETWKFVSYVHRALVTRSRNNLEKFAVCFRYNRSFASDVNSWVQFVVKNKVKDVSLLLSLSHNVPPDYMLPQMMYSNSSMTDLSLGSIIINPQKTIAWGALTTLNLSLVELGVHVVENILSGCPVLYYLSLWKCWGLNCLEINSQNLHVLHLGESNELNGESLQQISAPYISSLEVLLDAQGRKFRFTNIPRLVTARVEILGVPCDAKMLSYIDEILENLQHVKKLELGGGLVEAISELVEKGWRVPQSVREHLIVTALSYVESIPAIVSLLESSPLLETLVIQGDCYEVYIADVPPPISQLKEIDLNCDLLHLKTVNIRNFTPPCFGGEPMLTVARILLKRSTVLEKMVIENRNFFNEEFYPDYPRNVSSMEIAQSLLSLPRSSPKAVLQYYDS